MKMPRTPFSTRLSGSAKETELRIRNIFQWKKKRPPLVLFILTAVLLFSCFGLVSCQAKPSTQADKPVTTLSSATPPSENHDQNTPQTTDDSSIWNAVWQVAANGDLSPKEAALEMAQNTVDNYLSLPDDLSWKPEGIRLVSAEVFDHYWGETQQFCYTFNMDVNMTEEMMMSVHWGALGGPDEDGDGWYPYSLQVHVMKNDAGDWAYYGGGTGGGSVNLCDGEGLEYLLDCFFLTEGFSHDWKVPYAILDMSDEQLQKIPELLDKRTKGEAKQFCSHLGSMLREYDYWVQTTESLSAVLGKYAEFLNPDEVSDLYRQTAAFLEQEFHRVYDPYYDIQNLTISNWQETENEATFYYEMSWLYYNRDPSTVEYIQQALANQGQSAYETLYADYLKLHYGNYIFKIIRTDDGLELYSDISVRGPAEWVPTKIDDYILR